MFNLFVKKSTYDAVVADRDAYKAASDGLISQIGDLARECEDLRAERDEAMATAEHSVNIADALLSKVKELNAELATTYIRDAKGRIARHPSHVETAK